MFNFGTSSRSSELIKIIKEAGDAQKELIKKIKERDPILVRSELGMEFLKKTHVPTWREVKDVGRSPRNCFKVWFEEKNIALESLLPPTSKRRQKNMDVYWVGIAALAALLGGASFYLRQREQQPDSEPADLTPEDRSPNPSPESKVGRTAQEEGACSHLMAVAVKTGTIRKTGVGSVEAAPKFLTEGTHWWTGKSAEWNEVESSERMRKIDQIPAADDKLLVIAYEFQSTDRNSIDSRVEASDRLRQAMGEKSLETKGIYEPSSALVLEEFGFSR
jgi:hypothetical protein